MTGDNMKTALSKRLESFRTLVRAGRDGIAFVPGRLTALPWARYCTACHEMKEGFAAGVRWGNAV